MEKCGRIAGAALLALIGAGLAACGALPGGRAVTPTFNAVTPRPTSKPAGPSATIRDILDFYPLAKGASWTYQAELTVSVGPGEDRHWIGELTATVTDARMVSGFPVYRVDWSGYPDFAWPDLNTEYDVIRDAGIYQAQSADEAAALAQSEVFTQVAFLTWPLSDGKVWGDPQQVALNSGFYVWHLSAVKSLSVPGGTFQGCYEAMMYTNPDTTFRWFCPGKGLARFEYHHHGTPNDQVWELAAFKPGS